MSSETRRIVANHPNLFYAASVVSPEVIESDLLTTYEDGGVQSTVIAHLQWMLDRGHIIEITVARTGHHDDGPNGHYAGRAYDFWPLKSANQDDWMDANTQAWFECMHDLGLSEYAYQSGAVGDGSDSPESFHYMAKGYEERGVYVPGVSVFQDLGAPHAHQGVVAE